MKQQPLLAEQDANRRKYRGDLLAFFTYAAREAKKSSVEIAKEFWQLSRGQGRLTLNDYFLYRLFDDQRFSMEDKAQFISDNIHWPISNVCNDPTWKALTEDKWVSYKFMNACGIPTPSTIAVIDTSNREFGQTTKITTPSELRQFLAAQSDFPLFAKNNTGIGSFGAVVIAAIDGDMIVLEHAEPISCDAMFTKIVGSNSYLLQRFLNNHTTLQTLTRFCATVRTVNMVRTDGVMTPFALIKIPAPSNIADNYWREGNIIADIDVDTGEIRRAVTGKGIAMKELQNEPHSGEILVGKVLPFWQELLTLNQACAQLYAPVRYSSLDIALTLEGPVVVEINTGAAFDLPQLASGRGFLTEPVRDFFLSCGWKFKRGFRPPR